MLIARDTGKTSDFIPVPSGMHLARCYRIVDLGTQKSVWQDKTKHLHKIMIQWEIHSEDDDGKPLRTAKGEPMSISKNYTNVLGEKATLRTDLASWRGRDFTEEERRGFNLKNILGQWCMLTVARTPGKNGKEYSNIVAVSPVPAAIKKNGLPEGYNDIALFSLAAPDLSMFATFSESLQAKIAQSPEWQNRQPSAPEQIQDEQIPF
jgi:hypothetical protein